MTNQTNPGGGADQNAILAKINDIYSMVSSLVASLPPGLAEQVQSVMGGLQGTMPELQALTTKIKDETAKTSEQQGKIDSALGSIKPDVVSQEGQKTPPVLKVVQELAPATALDPATVPQVDTTGMETPSVGDLPAKYQALPEEIKSLISQKLDSVFQDLMSRFPEMLKNAGLQDMAVPEGEASSVTVDVAVAGDMATGAEASSIPLQPVADTVSADQTGADVSMFTEAVRSGMETWFQGVKSDMGSVSAGGDSHASEAMAVEGVDQSGSVANFENTADFTQATESMAGLVETGTGAHQAMTVAQAEGLAQQDANLAGSLQNQAAMHRSTVDQEAMDAAASGQKQVEIMRSGAENEAAIDAEKNAKKLEDELAFSEQKNEIADAAAATDMERETSELDRQKTQTEALLESWGELGEQMDALMSETLDKLVAQSSELLTDVLFGDVKDVGQAVNDMLKGILKQVVQQVIQIGIQMAISAAASKISGVSNSSYSGSIDKMTGSFGGLTVARTANKAVFGLFSFLHEGGQVYHSGGVVGSAASSLKADERPAILQTGEYVIRRDAVQSVGVQTLDSINQGKSPASTEHVEFHIQSWDDGDVERVVVDKVIPVLEREQAGNRYMVSA